MTTTVRKTLTILRRTKREAELSASNTQPWYWHATLGNGEIVAQGEEYENKADIVKMLTHLFSLTSQGAEELDKFHTIHMITETEE